MVWIKPAAGIFFGFGALGGQGRRERDAGGQGMGVLGGLQVAFGLLGGGVIGFGKKWGLYTGLFGALSLIPLFTIGFIGLPIGIHFQRRFGVGIILPVVMVNPIIAVIVAVLFAGLSAWVADEFKD